MLTRRTKAYNSSCLQTALVYLQPFHCNSRWKCAAQMKITRNKIMFIWTRSLSNAFRKFTVYVRINIISELLRPVEKNQTV